MVRVHQYLLSVISAAMICGILQSLIGKKSASAKTILMLCGILLTVTILGPWTMTPFLNVGEYIENFTSESDAIVAEGIGAGNQEIRAIIKERTEAYILDKAASLGLAIEANVTLRENDPPVPESVIMNGQASPYAKARLAEYIATDLGISEDLQVWN